MFTKWFRRLKSESAIERTQSIHSATIGSIEKMIAALPADQRPIIEMMMPALKASLLDMESAKRNFLERASQLTLDCQSLLHDNEALRREIKSYKYEIIRLGGDPDKVSVPGSK